MKRSYDYIELKLIFIRSQIVRLSDCPIVRLSDCPIVRLFNSNEINSTVAKTILKATIKKSESKAI